MYVLLYSRILGKIFVSFSLFFKCTCDKGIIFSFFKIRLETLCTLYNFSTLNIALCVSILFTTTHFETLKLDQQVSLILSILPFFPIVLLPIISSDSSLKKSFAVTRRLLRDLPFSLQFQHSIPNIIYFPGNHRSKVNSFHFSLLLLPFKFA